MASVARPREHKEVSCGRMGCAWEEGYLTSLTTSKPRGSSGHSLHFWNVLSPSVSLAKQLVPFLCSHLLPLMHREQTLGPFATPFTHCSSPTEDHLLDTIKLRADFIDIVLYSRHCAKHFINVLLLSLTVFSGGPTMVILILQMRKLKFREVGQLVQRPPASKWEGQESKHSDLTHNSKHHTLNFILHNITMPFLLSNSLGLCLGGQLACCDVLSY